MIKQHQLQQLSKITNFKILTD